MRLLTLLPTKLTTTIKNIDSIPNAVNITIVKQFHEYMEDNGASERPPSYFLN
jgi:hypothetical protein